MKKLLSAALALTLAACGGLNGAKPKVDFKEGVPSSEATRLKMPDSSSNRSAPSNSNASVQGGLADTYVLTRVTTVLVNGTTLFVLGALKAAVETTPSSVSGDVAIFGPHTPALSPTTWKLTVTRTDGNVFIYALDAKPRAADDSGYVTVLTGNHTVALDADGKVLHGFGHGDFTVDWDHASRLADHDRAQGSAKFTYAHDSATAPVTVAVDYNNVFSADETSTRNAGYRYTENPDTSGSFEFAADLNAQWWDPSKAALERWTVKSRWVASGQGRADVKLSGGDLTADATLSECWDGSFNSTFATRSFEAGHDYGTEATDCVLTPADYSAL